MNCWVMANMCYVRSQWHWPSTFGHQFIISSSSRPNGHFPQGFHKYRMGSLIYRCIDGLQTECLQRWLSPLQRHAICIWWAWKKGKSTSKARRQSKLSTCEKMNILPPFGIRRIYLIFWSLDEDLLFDTCWLLQWFSHSNKGFLTSLSFHFLLSAWIA